MISDELILKGVKRNIIVYDDTAKNGHFTKMLAVHMRKTYRDNSNPEKENLHTIYIDENAYEIFLVDKQFGPDFDYSLQTDSQDRPNYCKVYGTYIEHVPLRDMEYYLHIFTEANGVLAYDPHNYPDYKDSCLAIGLNKDETNIILGSF